MQVPVALLSLATAVPPHVLEQSDVAARARDIFKSLFARFPQLDDVFANAGIVRRYSAQPIDWFYKSLDWSERTSAYLRGASDLFLAAGRTALARAACRAADIDFVVTVSSTGIATPSLDAHVGPRLGFKESCVRVPVFGLGCAGGVAGLALAARLARAEPGKTVLLVVVELCTLAFRRDRAAKADVIATALFGDGAAAAVLRAGAARDAIAHIGAAGEHLWPDTLDIMGWAVDPIGFGVLLSRALPQFVEQRLADPVMRFLARERLDPQMRLVCHPGGAKVLEAVEAALRLQAGTLIEERAVLRAFGNMSAPTVMFVLEQALARGLTGPAMLSALGPGFTASFLALDAVGASPSARKAAPRDHVQYA
jgi:alkylresorcinol/alkylpyrone synthase